MEWEYKVFKIEEIMKSGDAGYIKGELDKFGADGWELVGVLEKPHIGAGWLPKIDDPVIVFKRRKSTP